MKLTTKTRYGIRAMIELALDWNGRGLFQKDISLRQGISYKYLDHIISALKTHGLIVNVEGKKSGYRLSRTPELISTYDVYKAFEAELRIAETGDEVIQLEVVKELWEGLNKTIIGYLKSHTLKDLADKQKEINNSGTSEMYVI